MPRHAAYSSPAEMQFHGDHEVPVGFGDCWKTVGCRRGEAKGIVCAKFESLGLHSTLAHNVLSRREVKGWSIALDLYSMRVPMIKDPEAREVQRRAARSEARRILLDGGLEIGDDLIIGRGKSRAAASREAGLAVAILCTARLGVSVETWLKSQSDVMAAHQADHTRQLASLAENQRKNAAQNDIVAEVARLQAEGLLDTNSLARLKELAAKIHPTQANVEGEPRQVIAVEAF